MRAVVTTTSSDAHTWNLVYLQRVLEEWGYAVSNVGPCPPVEFTVRTCVEVQPDLIVVSSVNGHGFRDGSQLVQALRSRPELRDVPAVIGGKLLTTERLDADRVCELLAAGYDAVFPDDATAASLRDFLDRPRHSVAL